MSIRPVKSVTQSRPTMEGAGVRLRRAFGFGDTAEFDPFLLMDDFRGDDPSDYSAGFPLASASRHRDDHLRAFGQRRSRRQPRQSRRARPRQRAMDDRRARHPAPGNAQGRRVRPDAWLPALGEPAFEPEDDRTALSGHRGARHSRSGRRRRRQGEDHLRRFLGKEGPGRGRRGRPAISRRHRSRRQAQDA